MENRSEQTIAIKLDTLPVPDMADAIWARIEAQLDIDLPTNGEGGAPAPSSPLITGPWTWGLSIFLPALLAAFYFYSRNTNTISSSSTPINTTQQDSLLNSPFLSPPSSGGARVPVQKLTPLTGRADDSTQNEILSGGPPVVQDTTQMQPAGSPPLTILETIKDTTAPQKKRRGVSGLSDADYRIVPKKDSSEG